MSMFADRIMMATRRYGPLCVGVDPHPQSIPALFGKDPIKALEAWGLEVVELAAKHCGVLKPQIALFEPYGPAGLEVFQALLHRARDLDLVTICDAKRGDIGSTAKGYARAYLSKKGVFESDAVTLNPYMGKDSIAPFVDVAVAEGKGVVVLGRTSNAGAKDVQMLDSDGHKVFERVITSYATETELLKGESGWSGFMWVVGATSPDSARIIRRLSPNALFLVPGYGAQGGSAQDALAGFVRELGSKGRLEGGVVNASRGVTAPKSAVIASNLQEWRAEISSAMAQARQDLWDAAT